MRRRQLHAGRAVCPVPPPGRRAKGMTASLGGLPSFPRLTALAPTLMLTLALRILPQAGYYIFPPKGPPPKPKPNNLALARSEPWPNRRVQLEWLQ